MRYASLAQPGYRDQLSGTSLIFDKVESSNDFRFIETSMRELVPLEVVRVGQGGAPIKRDQVWQRENVANVRALAASRVRDVADAIGFDDLLDEIERYTRARRKYDSPQSQLDAFCHLIAAIELDGFSNRSLDKRAALLGVARNILAESSIDPRRSRLAALHADLERCAAKLARQGQDLWSASWHEALADLSNAPDDVVDAAQSAAELALLAGDAPSLLERIIAREVSAKNAAELKVVRARLLRMSGRLEQASAVLAEIEGDSASLVWERAVHLAASETDLSRMAALLRRPAFKTPGRQLDFWLWARAIKSRRWRDQSVKLATIARRLKDDQPALRCAGAIDELTRKTPRPLDRLRRLGAALRASSDVHSVQRELLIWAAAARCLVAAKQPRFAQVASARYAALSRLTSANESSDVLGVAIAKAASFRPLNWAELEVSLRQKRIPKRARDRYLECGRMAISVARAKLKSRGQGSSDLPPEAIELLSDHLSHLKGPLLKLGQLLSHYGLGLAPEEREALGALYDQASGIDATASFQVIEDELGPPDALFADIEEQPFAAGSIGQVHRGRTLDGQAVAIKVQYPGIEDAARADLRILRVLTPLLSALVPKWNVRGLIDELETMVAAECDYRREADNQRAFKDMFADSPEIVVPEVIGTHSSRRVMTSVLLDGDRIEDYAARRDLSARTRAAETLGKFIVRTGIVHKLGHTDPHPGNFLFRDHSVGVLDFGSVKRWREPNWRDVLLACMRDDADALEAAFLRMNMIAGPLDCAKVIEALRRHTMRWTIGTEPSEFGHDDVAAEIKTWLLDRSMKNLVVQPDDLFGFRMYWGAFALLAKLKAPLDLSSVVERELARAGLS